MVRKISLCVWSAMIATAFLGSPAMADIVRLKFGNSFGQGWMFLDNDGVCKVATAGHVVKGSDGKARPMLVLDATGHEWTAGAPLLLSDDPDVAVIPIPAASNPRACGDGRLSPIGVARRVSNLNGGFIRTTGQTEQRDVPVTRRASVINSHGGSVFAVAETGPGEPFREGWSGSVVLDNDGPVGIVFEVSDKGDEAYAIRVDVIRDLMAGAPAPSASVETAKPSVVVETGSTVNPARGPDQIVGDGTSYWLVRPIKRSVVFTLHFPTPVQLQRVDLAAGMALRNQVTGLDISTKATTSDPDWTWANYCKPQGDDGANCHFLARTVSDLKIRLTTMTDASLAVVSVATH